MKKTILAIMLCLAMVMMPLCAGAEADVKTIYILTPTEDHGWTGSVATFAKLSAEEINAEEENIRVLFGHGIAPLSKYFSIRFHKSGDR